MGHGVASFDQIIEKFHKTLTLDFHMGSTWSVTLVDLSQINTIEYPFNTTTIFRPVNRISNLKFTFIKEKYKFWRVRVFCQFIFKYTRELIAHLSFAISGNKLGNGNLRVYFNTDQTSEKTKKK